jgi:hypothetical protein
VKRLRFPFFYRNFVFVPGSIYSTKLQNGMSGYAPPLCSEGNEWTVLVKLKNSELMSESKETPKKLTEFEIEVYRFIKRSGEMLTTVLPTRMMGAVPNLKQKGLVEITKRSLSPFRSKKRKFVKVKVSDS